MHFYPKPPEGGTTSAILKLAQVILNFIGNILVEGVIVSITLAILLWLKRKAIENMITNRYYFILAIKNKRSLNKEIKKHPPEIQALITKFAYKTLMHIFEEEEVTLDEYGDILVDSLSKNLKECIFIARTKPSQWYKPAEDTDEKLIDKQTARKHDLQRRIEDYFKKQKKLISESKKNNKKEIQMRRYLILEDGNWDNDKKRKRFIDDHKEAGIELYHCQPAYLSNYNWKEIAIFVSREERKWAVVGLKFDEDTIQKYIDGAETWIKVKLEEGGILESKYTNFLNTIHRNSESHVTFGQEFYFQKKENECV